MNEAESLALIMDLRRVTERLDRMEERVRLLEAIVVDGLRREERHRVPRWNPPAITSAHSPAAEVTSD